MFTIRRSRTAIPAFVTILAFLLSLPIAVRAEEQVITEEQVLTVDESDPAVAPIPAVAPSTDQGASGVSWAPARPIAPASSVEASRVLAAEQTLQTGDIGSMQEDALLAVVAAAPSWDETSGYRSVEASRTTIGHPVAIMTSEATRVIAAQALLSHDLGSMQEDALAAMVATARSGGETSGYNASDATIEGMWGQAARLEAQAMAFGERTE
jgi:hypothetical protein